MGNVWVHIKYLRRMMLLQLAKKSQKYIPDKYGGAILGVLSRQGSKWSIKANR